MCWRDGESEWRVLEEDTRTGGTVYTHDGLEPATENRYRVAAINAAGVSHLSAEAEARTDPVVPDAPKNLRAEARGPHRIDLEWDEPGYTGGVAVTGYRVEAYDGRLWTVLEADTRSRGTSYSHTGLDPGSEWRYRVSAIQRGGDGGAVGGGGGGYGSGAAGPAVGFGGGGGWAASDTA